MRVRVCAAHGANPASVAKCAWWKRAALDGFGDLGDPVAAVVPPTCGDLEPGCEALARLDGPVPSECDATEDRERQDGQQEQQLEAEDDREDQEGDGQDEPDEVVEHRVGGPDECRSEEQTYEHQSLIRISCAAFCLKK